MVESAVGWHGARSMTDDCCYVSGVLCLFLRDCCGILHPYRSMIVEVDHELGLRSLPSAGKPVPPPTPTRFTRPTPSRLVQSHGFSALPKVSERVE